MTTGAIVVMELLTRIRTGGQIMDMDGAIGMIKINYRREKMASSCLPN